MTPAEKAVIKAAVAMERSDWMSGTIALRRAVDALLRDDPAWGGASEVKRG